jgi:hypothetical protein
MTSITVQVPRHIATPRGAALAAWLFRQGALGIRWVAGARRQRAARRLHTARAVDANLVRGHARLVAATDPGYAADLYAAADRHELAD